MKSELSSIDEIWDSLYGKNQLPQNSVGVIDERLFIEIASGRGEVILDRLNRKIDEINKLRKELSRTLRKRGISSLSEQEKSALSSEIKRLSKEKRRLERRWVLVGRFLGDLEEARLQEKIRLSQSGHNR